MNLEIVNGLKEEEIMLLYEDVITGDYLSRCVCWTHIQTSASTCRDVNSKQYICWWGLLDNVQDCQNFCTNYCGSNSYLSYESGIYNERFCSRVR